MAQANYIVKAPELRTSQDYEFLRAEGVSRIEALAHKLWTDYNIHDPGITILELLCYAVTDLGYRTGYEFRDLMTGLEGGARKSLAEFHTARDILTTSPVTFDDLRKLLIDIRGVRNAWIDPACKVVYCVDADAGKLVDCPGAPAAATPNPPMNGLFDVFIEHEDSVLEAPRVMPTGMAAPDEGPEDFILPAGAGILFHAGYPFRLVSVRVYADRRGKIAVRLIDGSGAILMEKSGIEVSGRKEGQEIRLDFDIPVGEGYRLVALRDPRPSPGSPRPRLGRVRDGGFPHGIEDLVVLEAGTNRRGTVGRYLFFFDWKVSYTVIPPATEPPRLAAVIGPAAAPGDLPSMNVSARSVTIEARRRLVLDSLSVRSAEDGTVAVQVVSDDSGFAGVDCEATARAGESTNIPLSVELDGGREYRLTFSGTNVDLLPVGDPAEAIGEPGVAWIGGQSGPAEFLYFLDDVKVSWFGQPQVTSVTEEDVHMAVLDRLNTHRNLGEDYVNICRLRTEEVAVCADIEVSPGADIQEVLARVFHALQLDISPPVRFETIDELLAKGRTVEEIFEGPALDHGFIDDVEFRKLQRKCEIRSSDVTRIIMSVTGVVAVRKVSLLSFIDGMVAAHEDWVLPLSVGGSLVPRFSPARSKVVFFRNDLPYYPNRREVESLVRELVATEFRSRLTGHEKDLPIPLGEFRDPGDFEAIQNELPANYRVGRYRVPESEGVLRQAQARQLKAYLMFFEQLLANYHAQLARVADLFSWDADKDSTYFTQEVTGIADLADIYHEDYLAAEHGGDLPAALETLIEKPADARLRRDRFLDHLLARFAESFTEYSLLMYGMPTADARKRVIDDKRTFLASYPEMSATRGVAYDYRHPEDPGNLSGFRRRVYGLLGIRDASRRNLAGHSFEVTEAVEGEWRFILRGASGSVIFTSEDCPSEGAIRAALDFALKIGADRANYVLAPDGSEYTLKIQCKDEDDSDIVGRTSSGDEAELDEVVAAFAAVYEAEGFHVVEQVLLRKRTLSDPFLPIQLGCAAGGGCPEVRDPYSFRVAVVLPSWPERFQDLRFRRMVEETLRREAPAHIYLRICWVSHDQMKGLETAMNDWAGALAELAEGLGGCRADLAPGEVTPPTGETPLPTDTGITEYGTALKTLAEKLFSLDTVYPLARLHDCHETPTDEPAITLNNTSLGTF